jgi:hypothetical protein
MVMHFYSWHYFDVIGDAVPFEAMETRHRDTVMYLGRYQCGQMHDPSVPKQAHKDTNFYHILQNHDWKTTTGLI